MSTYDYSLSIEHESATEDRRKMIARVQAKRAAKQVTLTRKAVRRFKYAEVK